MSNISSVYVPDSAVGGGNNVESMLLGSMMGNGGGFGGNGMNSPFWALIILAFLRNWGGFGNGENNAQLSQIQDTLNTNQGNQLLMSAINGNATSIKELASAIGCNHNAVTAAINGVQSAICNLGSQNGMNFMQVVNAINSGNAGLANQLSQCCCDIKQQTIVQGYENRLANQQQSTMIQNGFSQVGYASAEQTCAIKQAIADQTTTLANKMDAQDRERMQREITALTADNANLRARAERQAELAPIYQQLNDIKCRQPESITIPYSPVTAVPNCVAWNAAIYGGFPYGAQGRGNVFS